MTGTLERPSNAHRVAIAVVLVASLAIVIPVFIAKVNRYEADGDHFAVLNLVGIVVAAVVVATAAIATLIVAGRIGLQRLRELTRLYPGSPVARFLLVEPQSGFGAYIGRGRSWRAPWSVGLPDGLAFFSRAQRLGILPWAEVATIEAAGGSPYLSSYTPSVQFTTTDGRVLRASVARGASLVRPKEGNELDAFVAELQRVAAARPRAGEG